MMFENDYSETLGIVIFPIMSMSKLLSQSPSQDSHAREQHEHKCTYAPVRAPQLIYLKKNLEAKYTLFCSSSCSETKGLFQLENRFSSLVVDSKPIFSTQNGRHLKHKIFFCVPHRILGDQQPVFTITSSTCIFNTYLGRRDWLDSNLLPPYKPLALTRKVGCRSVPWNTSVWQPSFGGRCSISSQRSRSTTCNGSFWERIW